MKKIFDYEIGRRVHPRRIRRYDRWFAQLKKHGPAGCPQKQ